MTEKKVSREDLFTVVHEQFFTDTTDYADIILPATTFFEHKDLQTGYGHYYIQISNQAIEPLGECRSNVELFRALAQRLEQGLAGDGAHFLYLVIAKPDAAPFEVLEVVHAAAGVDVRPLVPQGSVGLQVLIHGPSRMADRHGRRPGARPTRGRDQRIERSRSSVDQSAGLVMGNV